jgi:CheY-like chemotaxis protein
MIMTYENVEQNNKLSLVYRSLPAGAEPCLSRRLGGRNILVAHDSLEITAALASIFVDAGARVTESNDAAGAEMLIAWGGYELVFLDMAMAGAGGTLDLISQCRPELLVRTVALTGDLLDCDSESLLTARHPAILPCKSWLVDLVDLAAHALARGEKRRAA